MSEQIKFIPAPPDDKYHTRATRIFRQELGINNRVYPWVIMQNANGSTVKLTDNQMKELIGAILDWEDENT